MADWRGHKQVIAERIRQIGTAKILWGSDGAFGGWNDPDAGSCGLSRTASDRTGVPANLGQCSSTHP